MNAIEARKLTKAGPSENQMNTYMNKAFWEIKRAAECGLFMTNLYGIPFEHLPYVAEQLETEGYKCIYPKEIRRHNSLDILVRWD